MINQTIKKIREINNDFELVIVTKNQDVDEICKIYNSGELNFAENKVQEILSKRTQLPNNVKWHMIGHLQTNKVKLIAPFIHMIQSVDSIKILKQINKYAERNKRIINCLIQVKVSTDLNKYGFSVNDYNLFIKSDFKNEFPFVNIRGLMCISSLTSYEQKIRKEFKLLKKLSKKLNMDAPIVSMGMSNDYQIALQEGSNMLRLGTIIFS